MSTYTKHEVVEMLVNNMQKVMKLIDKSKYYKINFDKELVSCYRKRIIGKDRILSEYTFDYCIKEAQE